MGLRIGTNVAALGIMRNMSRVSANLNRNYVRLATGKRSVDASDKPGEVAMAARLRARIRSVEAAGGSLQDGISVVQTADSGLSEIENALVRLRELSVQANNGALSSSDRTALNTEFSSLLTAINSVASGTTFQGISLLADTTTKVTLQSGPDAGTTQIITMTDNDTTALGINATGVATTASAAAAISLLDTALASVGTNRATMGGYSVQFEASYNALMAEAEGLSSTLSRVADVDVAKEMAEMTKNTILQETGMAMLAQATASPRSVLALLGF